MVKRIYSLFRRLSCEMEDVGQLVVYVVKLIMADDIVCSGS